MRDQAGRNGETGEAKAEPGTEEATVRRNREEKERKKQRLSSEMLKRKRTKGCGSQAPAPEEESERGSPVEQLRERSRAGRKETNRKAEYENRERTHERSGGKERGKRGSESGAGAQGKPAVRRNREERKGIQTGPVAGSGEEADERKRKGSGKYGRREPEVST